MAEASKHIVIILEEHETFTVVRHVRVEATDAKAAMDAIRAAAAEDDVDVEFHLVLTEEAYAKAIRGEDAPDIEDINEIYDLADGG